MMTIFAWTSLISFFVTAILGLYVYNLNKKDKKNIYFTLYCMFTAYWLFTEFMFRQSESLESAHLWTRLNFLWPFSLSFMYIFSLLYTKKEGRFLKINIISTHLTALAISIIGLYYSLNSELILTEWGYTYSYTNADSLHMAFIIFMVLWLLLLITLSILFLLKYFIGMKDKIKRAQAIIVLSSFSFLLLTSIIIDWLFMSAMGIKSPSLNSLYISINAVIIGIGIWRYGLFKLSVSRAAEDIVTSMPDILLLVDRTGEINLANRSASINLGYENNELDEANISLIFADNEFEDKVSKAVDSMKEGTNRLIETNLKRKDGNTFPVSISIAKMACEQADSCGYIYIARDITSQKIMETMLKKSHDDLEKRVEERTEELARSNAELEEFAYVASHDLQEPLRMITGYLQLLKRRYVGKIDNDADEFIEFAVDGSARMQRLINDLLTYSRVTSKGMPIEPIEYDEVLKNAVSNLTASIQESDAEITHSQLPVAMGDMSQMERVFQNIIGNAIKFRGNKAPKIHIQAEKQNNNWLFSIKDNGIGIEPGSKDRIFKIFQRLHTIDKYKGTGIGLAVCKKAIQRHGGDIWIDSEVGKGTTFFFTMPSA